MHTFKFVSLPAAAVLMLLALVQGGVAQGLAEVVEVEPVSLGGLCGSIIGTASPPAYAATSTPTTATANSNALQHRRKILELQYNTLHALALSLIWSSIAIPRIE
ncbi:hypothetical protein B0H14DRAFT_2560113 [Mycena olivaceomarginata]|nr:hypothetical protein B0H14DRAFT_2560113 [Mycena olivaceomarginata]